MHLESQYQKIVKATTGKDTSRPVLQALHVKRIDDTHGELAAADGFILAVVPCTLEPDDVPGLISQDCLNAAFKASGKTRHGAQMMLKADTVRIMDGTEWPRPEGQFPNYDKIVPHYGRETTLCPSLNPRLLCNLKDALGLDYTGGMLQAHGETQPVLLHTQAPDAEGRPQGAHGVIMPLVSNARSFTRTDTAGPVDHAQCVSDHSDCTDRATADQTIAELTRERDQAIEASKRHLERVHEVSGQRDEAIRAYQAAQDAIIMLQDQLKATEACAALLETERNAAQAAVPVMAGGAPALDAARTYATGFIIPERRAYALATYNALTMGQPVPACPAALAPDTAAKIARRLTRALGAPAPSAPAPIMAGGSEGWTPTPEPPPAPPAPSPAPETTPTVNNPWLRPHRHICFGVNDTGGKAEWACGPRCSDPRILYRFCASCEEQYRPRYNDPTPPAAREAAQRAPIPPAPTGV